MVAFVGKILGMGLIGLLLLAILWVISALFWGWILMLVLGALGVTKDGHTIGFPLCFGLGFAISLVLG